MGVVAHKGLRESRYCYRFDQKNDWKDIGAVPILMPRQWSAFFLANPETFMKLNRRALAISMGLASASLAGLLPGAALAQKKIVLGFSQVGAESEWRTANTESIKSSAAEAGIELKFSDAQQ
ncbi:MAG: hypothetical protein Q7T73_02495, partial [Beijerinckiaceae bacterium]|nr:hypothetical protein [Beijerinckiaceae bacterium]